MCRVLKLDDVARSIASQYGLKEASIVTLREAIRTDANLAVVLRQQMVEHNLTLLQTHGLVRAGYESAVVWQLLELWDQKLLTDQHLDQIIRESL